MAHFRTLSPASAGLGADAKAAVNLHVEGGAPYWQTAGTTHLHPEREPFRPCPWLGEFIPLSKVRTEHLPTATAAVVHPGRLCPKCTTFRTTLKTALLSSELDSTTISAEGDELVSVAHHESLKDLLESSAAGCHLCTIIWQELEIKDYSTSPMEYLKSKLGSSRESMALEVRVMRFHDVYKRRKFSYRLDVHGNEKARIGFLALTIASANVDGHLTDSLAPQSVRTDSTSHMYLLNHWFSECFHTHKSCNLRVDPSGRMPKRLLDVHRVESDGILRLIDLQKQDLRQASYAALSACWGDGETYKLTSATAPDLNRGVHVSELPKTVQDAVRVTLAMHIGYLWVDALCIQQDSIADWNEEAKNMMSVYSNSLLTIAGTGATSCTDGLFCIRDPLIYLPCPLFQLDTESQVSLSVSFSPLISWHDFAALHGRGWVVQERLLAPRTINFGVCAVWECREKLTSECTAKEEDAGQSDMRKRFAELIFWRSGPENHQHKLMKLWYVILAQYTGSTLSHKSDRLAAINGIMSAFQHEDLTPWFGLWKPLTIWGLLWSVPIAYYNDAARQHGPDLNDFPTWSWSHLNFDVKYELLPYQAPYDDVEYMADLSDNENCDCRDHAFRCEQRKVYITAPLLDIEIQPSKTQFQTHNHVSKLCNAKVEDNHVNIVWEDSLCDAVVGQCQMVLLVVRKSPGMKYRCAGLLLVPVDGDTCFQRSGVADFEISSEHYDTVRKMSALRVTLI